MHLTCPELSKLDGITHGFFTREGGRSTGIYASLNCGYGSGDNLDTVSANRALVAKALGQPPESLCTAYQIHSANVAVLEKPWMWKDALEVDALVTRTPGIALGVLSADCLPILFADTKKNIIGAAHSGWKGAIGGVIEATLDAMVRLGASPHDIHATIGPAIGQGSYEIGEEFHETFLREDAGNNIYFLPSPRKKHFQFDLAGYAKDRLKNAGVMQINILAHDTCLEENRFFSYRRACLRSEGPYGRQISAIVLEK